jgi:arabinose-5-phosphate isomerase
VEDAMHVADAIPRVRPSAPIKDVILEMTSKKLGCTTVCKPDGHLIGIITDGDLRRLLQKKPENTFALTAAEVMTAEPKTIGRDELAAKAVQVMEEHSIMMLVVVERQQRVEGILHLHDLLKLGVV